MTETESKTTIRFCRNCEYFIRNSKFAPVFAFGYWIGGPDAGKCELEKGGQKYKVMTDSCEDWKSRKT